MVSSNPGLPWTIFKVLSWTESYFDSLDIEGSRLAAEILLGHALGVKRLDLYLQYDRPLQEKELTLYKSLIRRRVNREPVAYITGSKGFFLSELDVTTDVLIPRPDTEVLVETALDLLKTAPGQTVLELGVGSGAVILSLAREGLGCSFFGVDLSDRAVAVAAANGKKIRNMDPVALTVGSWLTCFRQGDIFDLIVSNPPYIPSREIDTLEPEIRSFEPRMALDGGNDGLDSLQKIIDNAHLHLRSGGVLLVETGCDQKEQVVHIAAMTGRYHPLVYIRDYGGHDRVAKLVKK
ncbi:MAG TPA: peptide chain release factor N(5)-glutamine methyltransferase [Desulfobacteraceae bacterium]|nr:peptide chain release factor N(5)-glutamine methyltransferase [Desulfobacteraceae bacterium]